MELQGSTLTKTVLKKRNRVGNISQFLISKLATCYTATIIETVQYWHSDNHLNRQSRIESLGVNAHIYVTMMLDKLPRMFNGEKIISSVEDNGMTG